MSLEKNNLCCQIVFCDDFNDVLTPFIRKFFTVCTPGQAPQGDHADFQLDGETPYIVQGQEVVCTAGGGIGTSLVRYCDNTTGNTVAFASLVTDEDGSVVVWYDGGFNPIGGQPANSDVCLTGQGIGSAGMIRYCDITTGAFLAYANIVTDGTTSTIEWRDSSLASLPGQPANSEPCPDCSTLTASGKVCYRTSEALGNNDWNIISPTSMDLQVLTSEGLATFTVNVDNGATVDDQTQCDPATNLTNASLFDNNVPFTATLTWNIALTGPLLIGIWDIDTPTESVTSVPVEDNRGPEGDALMTIFTYDDAAAIAGNTISFTIDATCVSFRIDTVSESNVSEAWAFHDCDGVASYRDVLTSALITNPELVYCPDPTRWTKDLCDVVEGAGATETVSLWPGQGGTTAPWQVQSGDLVVDYSVGDFSSGDDNGNQGIQALGIGLGVINFITLDIVGASGNVILRVYSLSDNNEFLEFNVPPIAWVNANPLTPTRFEGVAGGNTLISEYTFPAGTNQLIIGYEGVGGSSSIISEIESVTGGNESTPFQRCYTKDSNGNTTFQDLDYDGQPYQVQGEIELCSDAGVQTPVITYETLAAICQQDQASPLDKWTLITVAQFEDGVQVGTTVYYINRQDGSISETPPVGVVLEDCPEGNPTVTSENQCRQVTANSTDYSIGDEISHVRFFDNGVQISEIFINETIGGVTLANDDVLADSIPCVSTESDSEIPACYQWDNGGTIEEVTAYAKLDDGRDFVEWVVLQGTPPPDLTLSGALTPCEPPKKWSEIVCEVRESEEITLSMYPGFNTTNDYRIGDDCWGVDVEVVNCLTQNFQGGVLDILNGGQATLILDENSGEITVVVFDLDIGENLFLSPAPKSFTNAIDQGGDVFTGVGSNLDSIFVFDTAPQILFDSQGGGASILLKTITATPTRSEQPFQRCYTSDYGIVTFVDLDFDGQPYNPICPITRCGELISTVAVTDTFELGDGETWAPTDIPVNARLIEFSYTVITNAADNGTVTSRGTAIADLPAGYSERFRAEEDGRVLPPQSVSAGTNGRILVNAIWEV